MRDSLWDFNRFSLGKPCQKRLLSKRQLLMLIDLNMNPSPQGGFIVAQDRSFLKPRRSGKSGTFLCRDRSQAFTCYHLAAGERMPYVGQSFGRYRIEEEDRKSTRLNSS